MNEMSYIDWMGVSDTALLETIGAFIKHHRLQQNKTQGQLAKEAGVSRSTLSLFENGENTTLLIFIQLLRALKLLQLLQEFRVKQQLSPLQLAKIEQSKRTRARRSGTVRYKPTHQSDW